MTLFNLTSKLVGRALGGQVVNVLRIRPETGRGKVFERLLGIAHRFAPGERIEEVQAFREAMLHAYGKTFVVVVARRIDPSDRTEGRNGTARCKRQRLPGRTRYGLVVIGEDRQPQAVISVVGQLNHGIPWEFPLHREEPVLSVRPLEIGGNVSDV